MKKIEDEEYKGIRIVVLQRGWVVVGKYYKQGSYIRLESGGTIRVWGTQNKAGLSYLADEGPTKDTILDLTVKNNIYFHELTEIMSLDVDSKKWEKIIK